MKRNINITIDGGLTPEQETAQIAKRLMQKTISGTHKNEDIKQIGTRIDAEYLETTITVKRVFKEPVITTKECNVCGCIYYSNSPFHYFHNYGGATKKVLVCSTECVDFVVENFGDRVSRKKSTLKRAILYHR